jgi:hypothetical protein
MLTVSAVMLSTATYAWFTMSREVEVTNISMVATTPEDIQISLGRIGSDGSTAATQYSESTALAMSTGYLVGSGTTASNGQVAPPAEDWDWADTADFSHYYEIGKLIPASSTTGESIFFTPDANGVGKTVKSDARYWTATTTTVNDAQGVDMSTIIGGSGTAKATLHAIENGNDKWASTSGSSTTGVPAYTKSTAWNNTNDDGYYVDIPIWLRTSSTETTSLIVKGYVAPRKADQKTNNNDEALYRAVRVALLNPATQDCGGNSISGTNLLPLTDGMTGISSGSAGSLSTTPFSGTSILNWYGNTYNSGAVNSVLAEGSGAQYTAASQYAYTPFVTLKSGTGGAYGEATKVIVRVWLEGNDPDCWNDTAGQDWYINLKFGRSDIDDENVSDAKVFNQNGIAYHSGT